MYLMIFHSFYLEECSRHQLCYETWYSLGAPWSLSMAFLYPEAYRPCVSFVLFFFGVWSLCSRQSQVVTWPPANRPFHHKINHLKIGQTWHEIRKVCAWENRNQIIVTKNRFSFPFSQICPWRSSPPSIDMHSSPRPQFMKHDVPIYLRCFN